MKNDLISKRLIKATSLLLPLGLFVANPLFAIDQMKLKVTLKEDADIICSVVATDEKSPITPENQPIEQHAKDATKYTYEAELKYKGDYFKWASPEKGKKGQCLIKADLCTVKCNILSSNSSISLPFSYEVEGQYNLYHTIVRNVYGDLQFN